MQKGMLFLPGKQIRQIQAACCRDGPLRQSIHAHGFMLLATPITVSSEWTLLVLNYREHLSVSLDFSPISSICKLNALLVASRVHDKN